MKYQTSYLKLAILSISFAALLSVTWLIVAAISSAKIYFENSGNDAASHHGTRADFNKLPRLSADKKTLVVTSEDALPNAFEFLRLNMYLPIQKIVLMKPGGNDTVRVYPIPREGMIGLTKRFAMSAPEIGFMALFLIFIVGSFMYVFTSISGTKVYWDDDGWIINEDICLDVNELSCEDEAEREKLLIKAEMKRKEIEDV